MSCVIPIRDIVRRAVMEEVNGLGVRAAVRESIEAAGVTKEEIRATVRETIDSYVRSTDIVAVANNYLDSVVKTAVKEAVDRFLDERFTSSRPTATEVFKEAIRRAILEEFTNNYSITVRVRPQQDSTADNMKDQGGPNHG